MADKCLICGTKPLKIYYGKDLYFQCTKCGLMMQQPAWEDWSEVTFKQKMHGLSKETLIELICEYEDYIMAHDDLLTNWCPVCIEEFFTNELEYIREEK